METLPFILLLIAPSLTLQSLVFRYDGKCGDGNPAPNGEPAQCDPNSDSYCCSKYGWCGNTADHCGCSGCTDYRELERDVRFDGRCGDRFPLSNGQPAKCDPHSEAPCCSKYGWCGKGSDFCNCDGCRDYSDLELGVKGDGTCGPSNLLTNGQPGKCDSSTGSPCCSKYGWCGGGYDYCLCDGCIDYRDLERDARGDGQCGEEFPLKNGQPGKCDPYSKSPCCSKYGWCGSGSDYCACSDCIDYSDIERGVRGDGRCGNDFRLKNGQPGQCDPNSQSPCCSKYGWCGNGSEFCACNDCVDYRV